MLLYEVSKVKHVYWNALRDVEWKKKSRVVWKNGKYRGGGMSGAAARTGNYVK